MALQKTTSVKPEHIDEQYGIMIADFLRGAIRTQFSSEKSTVESKSVSHSTSSSSVAPEYKLGSLLPNLGTQRSDLVKFVSEFDFQKLKRALEDSSRSNPDFNIFLLRLARIFATEIANVESSFSEGVYISEDQAVQKTLNLILQSALGETLNLELGSNALDIVCEGYKKIQGLKLPDHYPSDYLDHIRLCMRDIFYFYRQKLPKGDAKTAAPKPSSSAEQDADLKKHIERSLAKTFFMASAYHDKEVTLANLTLVDKNRNNILPATTLFKNIFKTMGLSLDEKKSLLQAPILAAMEGYNVNAKVVDGQPVYKLAKTNLELFVEEACLQAEQFIKEDATLEHARQTIGLVTAADEFVAARRSNNYHAAQAAYARGRALCEMLPEHDAAVKKRFWAFLGVIVVVTALPTLTLALICHYYPSCNAVAGSIGATIGAVGSAAFLISGLAAYLSYLWMEKNAVFSGSLEQKYCAFFNSNKAMRNIQGEDRGVAEIFKTIMTTPPRK